LAISHNETKLERKALVFGAGDWEGGIMPTIRFCSIAFNARRTNRAAAGRREISNRVPHAAWLPAAVLAVLVPLLSSTALAQSTTGSIYGQITDPSGAVVIGAHVTALNQATGVIYPSDSDGQGN
jgi:hypothetical protein